MTTLLPCAEDDGKGGARGSGSRASHQANSSVVLTKGFDLARGFTPGPWSINADNFDGVVRVTESTGPNTARFRTLARDIYGVANAHLISAAPEMFEALRLFVEEYDAGDEANGVALMLTYNAALEAAKTALRKARGEVA